jgi:hypothetical protein
MTDAKSIGGSEKLVLAIVLLVYHYDRHYTVIRLVKTTPTYH